MASSAIPFVAFPSQSGLNSSSPQTYLLPDELTIADNVTYGLSGERRKRLGTARYNAAVIGAATNNIVALAEHWRFGASLTATQRIVACSGAQIWSDSGTGVFTSINAAFGSNTSLTTNIVTAQGFAVFSDGSSTPQKWDQTTMAALGTGAPNFTAAAYHLRRLFTVGTAANPSRVDISAGGDITTWTGGDTANFILDDDDGDQVLGVSRTFHKRLYFYKGPNFGSIHEIAGNTLSTFTRDRVFNGLPALNHKGIITTPNDVYWLSREGVHSLVTTVQYGDTQSAFLSLPIQDLWRDNLIAQGSLNAAVGFWNPVLGLVGWCYRPSGASTNTQAIVYHYLLSDPTP